MDLTGETYVSISREWGYSEDSLRRHKTNHIAAVVGDIKAIMERARIEAMEEARRQELEEIKDEVANEVKTGMAARLETCATFLDQLQAVRDKAANLLDQAEASQDMRAAGTFLRELREQIRLMAELEGKISSQPQITIINSPEWVELRTVIVTALRPHPEALQAVLEALPDESPRSG